MDAKDIAVGQKVIFSNKEFSHLYGVAGEVTSYNAPYEDVTIKTPEGVEKAFWVGNLSRVFDTPSVDTTAKASNPKDAIGSTKLPLNLVPDSLEVYAALAFTEGATKYGSTNWRVAGVRASIYYAAMKRHQKKYWNGEWADPVTNVPHLASVIACAAIILDANLVGKLTDDRPPAADLSALIDGMEATVKHLKELHKDKTPHHHTQADLLGPLVPK